MAGYLTTHVLDTARGCPAADMSIRLYRLDGENRTQLAEMTTNEDGRTDSPILPEDRFSTGMYELVFAAGEYLRGQPGDQDGLPFLDDIPVRFRMEDRTAHYHVPLLLSPYGYSTYRGS
ncbi:hydroxyisourate hydrolase [Notoacmeibacter sp. MSK16QG-6]|uniref:hydroxyisourate hydrolase n=1 Tax=Notoacmeibacter sp. MSK16QG-6 TaxID=2957982 RepID=UPI00209FF7AF|nr:hydroxyisourate hydrolase [Notoacmeibacter sp. MSK16QG-6]MCP1199768.1 hydroxyisourate hydrolase [Notoacmeibacter sp. MSK16QG-6]